MGDHFIKCALSVDCSAQNLDPIAVVPDRLHLDQCHINAPVGSPLKVDLLGSGTEFRLETGHHSIHDHSAVLCWTG